jgi:hypothetical protein
VQNFLLHGVCFAPNDACRHLTFRNYDSHGATTFQLADGTFSYDRKTGSWQEMK